MKKLKIYFHTNNSEHDNDAVEWEIVDQKNWRGFYLQLDDFVYSVSAIGIYRHNQEMEESVDEKGFASIDIDEFVVKDVSKDTLVTVIPFLVKTGFLERLKEMSKDEVDKIDLTLVAEIDVE